MAHGQTDRDTESSETGGFELRAVGPLWSGFTSGAVSAVSLVSPLRAWGGSFRSKGRIQGFKGKMAMAGGMVVHLKTKCLKNGMQLVNGNHIQI